MKAMRKQAKKLITSPNIIVFALPHKSNLFFLKKSDFSEPSHLSRRKNDSLV
jgi:hypothetical protein